LSINVEVEIARHEEQICKLRKDMNGHIASNDKDFDDIAQNFRDVHKKLDKIQEHISNRLPNWASFLFAALTCLLGLLGGQLLK